MHAKAPTLQPIPILRAALVYFLNLLHTAATGPAVIRMYPHVTSPKSRMVLSGDWLDWGAESIIPHPTHHFGCTTFDYRRYNHREWRWVA